MLDVATLPDEDPIYVEVPCKTLKDGTRKPEYPGTKVAYLKKMDAEWSQYGLDEEKVTPAFKRAVDLNIRHYQQQLA